MNALRLATVFAQVLISAPITHGQLLLSTNDNKVTLVNGVATVVKSPPPDTLTVIDMVEKEIQVLSLDVTTLRDTGVRIAVKGGPAIRIAER